MDSPPVQGVPYNGGKLPRLLGAAMPTTACPGFFAAAPMGRREVLRAGSLGLFGLGLPQLLRAGKEPARRKAKACIVLFMWGGPAHQDTWDLNQVCPALPEIFHGHGADHH